MIPDLYWVSTLIRPSGRMQLGSICLGCRVPIVVSTLIRPSGRMQPVDAGLLHCWAITSFQPSSDLQAGCNGQCLFRRSCTRGSPSFQPSSDLQAGCNRASMLTLDWASRCFNPHPTFRPDATPVPGFPIGSSRTSSTMPLDGHFWDEMFKRLTRAATRTRTSSVRGRQQWVRVTPRGGRRSRPRCPARIPRLVGPGCRAACKTGCCPASRR